MQFLYAIFKYTSRYGSHRTIKASPSAQSWIYLGNKVGIQATFENAEICKELILANSETPPDFESGPTGSTRHRISSLQNP